MSPSNATARLPLTRWEAAYRRFETPEQEVAKFVTRLRGIGADRWDRRWRILEVCSGRGSGLRAWQQLGFTDLVGVDFSLAQVARYEGPGRCLVGDARALPIATASRDVVVVQGGLHHMFTLPDVGLALREMQRVVTSAGKIVIIEPWLTPFLRAVHFLSERRSLRRLWPRLDALAVMIEEERSTYEQWLHAPDQCLQLFRRSVAPEILTRRFGKITVVGTPVAREDAPGLGAPGRGETGI